MDAAAIGFHLGAIPGVFILLRTQFRYYKAGSEAWDIARAKGEFYDFNWNRDEQYNYSFRSSTFIKPTDGPGTREAKEMLLARRSSLFAALMKGGAIMVGGTALGTFLGALVHLVVPYLS
jgi:hypothetical protein